MRRCIFFAGFHTSSGIDEVDLYHLEKLCEIGDVYCLYDNSDTTKDDISKLVELGAKLVLAKRHGEYDFGSWKRLIREVGWSNILNYDELIFVNNSIIPLGPLNQFLTEFEQSDDEFFAPCLLDEHYVGEVCSVADYLDHNDALSDSVMFPSVFWAMKKSLFKQAFVSSFFDQIRPETNRLDVCYKYEREFSRKLLRRNVKIHLAVKDVYPTAYLYTEMAFNIVSPLMPYIKRKALTGEFYQIRVLHARVDGLCSRLSEQQAELLRREFDRQISPRKDVDRQWYLAENPDVAEADYDPEDHFKEFGEAEGRPPNARCASYMRTQKAVQSLAEAKVYDVDEHWYLMANPDVATVNLGATEHFWSDGHKEMREPNGKFGSSRYLVEHPELVGAGISPFTHFIETRDRQVEAIEEQLAAQYAASRKLAIFFNVARDTIGGGMLSINRFANHAQAMVAETGFDVAVSGVPLGARAVAFSKFEAPVRQLTLQSIAEHCDPEEVMLLIPEVFAISFAQDLTAFELSWLVRRKKLRVVILNQNQEMMPGPKELQEAFLHLTTDVTISTAHTRYCNGRLADRYHMPVKQLTPYLPEMMFRTFAEKERLIILSCDEIAPQSGYTREYIVRMLERRLPSFQFVAIERMSLDDYLDLASRAMFSITFGEGMDGYYIEPVLAGGISFAVYNNIFFPENFEGAPGIFSSWAELEMGLPELVNSILANGSYDDISNVLKKKLNESYSAERSSAELRSLLFGSVDYKPTTSKFERTEAEVTQRMLADQGVRLMKFGSEQVAATPDGLVVNHSGGETLEALCDLYVRGVYEMRIPTDGQYVFIDVGANIGLHSMHVLRNNNSFKKAYAFQGAGLASKILRDNVSGNGLDELVQIRQLCLGRAFTNEFVQFSSSRSVSFSPLANTLAETLPGQEEEFYEFTEVETIPANVAINQIISENPGCTFVLRCCQPGTEADIILDIASAGLLEKIDTLIIEGDSCQLEELYDLLSAKHFQLRARMVIAEGAQAVLAASRFPDRFVCKDFVLVDRR